MPLNGHEEGHEVCEEAHEVGHEGVKCEDEGVGERTPHGSEDGHEVGEQGHEVWHEGVKYEVGDEVEVDAEYVERKWWDESQPPQKFFGVKYEAQVAESQEAQVAKSHVAESQETRRPLTKAKSRPAAKRKTAFPKQPKQPSMPPPPPAASSSASALGKRKRGSVASVEPPASEESVEPPAWQALEFDVQHWVDTLTSHHVDELAQKELFLLAQHSERGKEEANQVISKILKKATNAEYMSNPSAFVHSSVQNARYHLQRWW